MPSTAQQILDRETKLRDAMYPWETDWQDVTRLMAPMTADTQTQRLPGQSRTQDIYDSTAMMANQKLAANLMGAVTNQAIDWHRLKMHEHELDREQDTQLWLNDGVNRHLLNVYGASNFYQAMHTFYLNYGSFGTAAMFIEDALTTGSPMGAVPGVRFTPVPHGTYTILEDADGRVQTFHRRVRLSPVQAVQRFGHDRVSQRTRERLQSAQLMDVPMPYLQAIFPREDWDITSLSNTRMPFANVILEMDSQEIIEETGHWEFPVAVARWEKLSDSPWGFGPGHMALPDTRTLNRMKELQIQMLALWVQPPMKQVFEGVLGSISLEPLAVNVVRDQNDLTPLDLTGRPDLVQISQEDLRRSIHDIFFVADLQGLPPADATNMTAFEVAQRIEQMQRLMGPAFHRLTAEFLNPLVDRVFGLEWRKGLIPMPPPAVIEAARARQGQIDIEYQGPLARAQRAADVQAIAQVYAVGSQIMQATGQADVFDTLDSDLAIRRAAEAASVPPEIVRDALAVARLRQARQQAAQQQQQQEEMQQTAQSLGQVAPFLKALNMGQGQGERMAA